jgi:hypothetical protein
MKSATSGRVFGESGFYHTATKTRSALGPLAANKPFRLERFRFGSIGGADVEPV